MFKNQQKIKNPLLKQIGNKNYSHPQISSSINKDKEKKIDLEVLLDYVKNIKTTASIKDESFLNTATSCDSTSEVIIEPKNGEYMNFICKGKNIREITDGLNFKRYGVLKSSQGKLKFYNNFSLLSSLMTCLSDKFIILDEQSQLNYVKSLKLYIYNTFSKSFYDSQNYKELSKDFNFDRISISKNLFNYDIQRNEFLVISDIFHINLFIFDISRDKLFFTGVKFIPYKKNIFLIKKEDGFFEPLYLDNSFCIEEQHDFIQYLIENNFKVDLFFKSDSFNVFDISQENLDRYSINKEVKLDINNKILERRLYNLNKTCIEDDKREIENEEIRKDELDNINDYTENKNIIGYNVATEIGSLSDSDDESNSSIDSELSDLVKTTKYNKTDLKKMKLNELVTISKSLNIKIEYEENNKIKKKTKDTLIEEILKK
jgi:hypothetical protein